MKKERFIHITCIICMLTFLLTACSNTEAVPAGDSISTTAGQITNIGDTELPLTDEKRELSLWMYYQNDYIKTPAETRAAQVMEEWTNVHIDYQVVNGSDATEQFSLMIAGGEYPDMVKHMTSYYSGGINKGIEDGIFMDMTDLVLNHMPNYLKLASTDENAMRGIVSDDGRYPLVYILTGNNTEIEGQKLYIGLTIRKDWLDDCGLAVPETIDEWHTVLTAFKEEKGADAPLIISNTGTMLWGAFATAYGVGTNFYIDDGIIKYGPAEEGYKQYLQTFNQWYAEGLIDKDFPGHSASLAPADYMATGRSGAASSLYIYGGDAYYTMGFTEDAGINYVGAPFPVLNKGDQPKCDAECNVLSENMSITTACEDPVLAAKWLDFQYTYEAMLLNGYGVEGESYIIDDQGNITYTDAIMNNPDGYTPYDALNFYAAHIYAPGRMNWQTEEPLFGPEALALQDVWTASNMSMKYLSNITMTGEEGEIYNSKYAAIESLAQEMSVKYILGTESFDNYDQFVAKLYEYGLQELLDIKQAAYDRYMNRSISP